ncbi:MAG: 3-oxoacyl-ACP reductase FabG [Planctomycetales bacterium]|nr:3-oxoacyl-ACP reductase FabG [Planctomycetales bacterium]
MGRLEGKTALVTGGSRGIGRAISLELAGEGAQVAINYSSNEAKAQEVADEITKMGGKSLLIKANIGDAKEARAMVDKAAAEFTHLDILVNNAGITRDSLLPRMTDEQFMEVVQTNLGGCFFCTSAAIPYMTNQSYGRIVNISSMNGQLPAIGQANYSASKGGIIAFTRTAAAELVRFGITVNTVAPGYTDTDMFAAVPPAIQAAIRGKIPLGRFAHAEEIAKAVLFLVADGDYVTGQQINVNGGAYM